MATARSLLSTTDARQVLPHLTKGSSHLFGEERWLFERSEMPAFVEFVPIEKLRVGSLSPHLRWREHVSLEDADGNRKLQRHSDEIPSETLVVEPRRRCGGVGKPVECDVIQHMVDGDGLLGITFVVGPALKLLVDPHR